MRRFAAFGVFFCLCTTASAQQIIPKGSWVLEDNGPPNTIWGDYPTSAECAAGLRTTLDALLAKYSALADLIQKEDNQQDYADAQANGEILQQGFYSAQEVRTAICVQQ
jgi:hypothetical protein